MKNYKKKRLLLESNVNEFVLIRKQVPRWPSVFSNGFYTHASTRLLVTYGKSMIDLRNSKCSIGFKDDTL